MSRIYNFSAGPAALPESVLRAAQADLVDFEGQGLSVMEMSHRGKDFRRIAEQAEADVRALLQIPNEYAVLFLQGGATLQFAAVPLNLASEGDRADYVLTGAWSKKASQEALAFLDAHEAASSADDHFRSIPERSSWDLSPDAAYVHVTMNETIGGVEFPAVPDGIDRPLVADMSSTLLSRPIPVSRFGLIYAGAQKNIGPAGVTLVIVDRSLLGRARATTPRVLDYGKQAEAGSMLNTPPCWAWYVCGLVFRQLLEEGGLAAAAERNRRKAKKLYAYLDGSSLYENPVEPRARSWMNVPFLLKRDGLDATFLAEAEAHGLHGLKGHRSVGGMRASIYNAVGEEAVDALISFLQAFEASHG